MKLKVAFRNSTNCRGVRNNFRAHYAQQAVARQVEREAVTTHLCLMLWLNVGQAIPPTPVRPHSLYKDSFTVTLCSYMTAVHLMKSKPHDMFPCNLIAPHNLHVVHYLYE
jgi:hypothetical protein